MNEPNSFQEEEAQCAESRHFEVGQKFEIAGRVVEIFEINSPDCVVLRDQVMKENRVSTFDALKVALSKGSIQLVSDDTESSSVVHPMDVANAPWQDPETLSAADINLKAIKVMNQKMTWIKALKNKRLRTLMPSEASRRMLKEVEKERGEVCPFTIGTLYRASLALVKAGGSARALQPKFDNRGGRGKSRLSPPVEIVVHNRIERLKAEPKLHVTVSDLCNDIQKEMKVQCPLEQVPSRPTVERRVRDALSAYEWVMRTKGKAAANALFRNTYNRIPASAPLEVVQFDDTDSRLFLISAVNGLPYGRAFITAGIDEYTGAVMGLDVSDQPRSTASAWTAFSKTLMPKNFSDPEFARVKNRVNTYGNIGLAIFDNAQYNHADAMEAAVRDTGCEIMYAKPRTPTEKPDVEYSFKLLKEKLVPRFPGSLIGVDRRDQLKDAMKDAVLTVEDFNQELHKWYFDEYANNVTARGGSPNQMWQEWFKDRRPLLPRYLPSSDVLKAIPQQLKFRSSGGLLRLGLSYKSDPLTEIRRRCGSSAEVDIRYDPADLTFVWVIDPETRKPLKVPCVDDLAFTKNLTNQQLKWIRKVCAEKKWRNPDLVQLVSARNEMVQRVQEMLDSKKLLDRRKANQNRNSGKTIDQEAVKDQKEQKAEKVTAVSAQVVKYTTYLDSVLDQQAKDERWD